MFEHTSVLGRVKNLIAMTREGVRGDARVPAEVANELKDLLPKLEEEFKTLKDFGHVHEQPVTLDGDGLPAPQSAHADYTRALQEGQVVLDAAKKKADTSGTGADATPSA